MIIIRIKIFIITFFCWNFSCHSQEESSIIFWDKEEKLQYKDFLNEKDKREYYDAISYTNIYIIPIKEENSTYTGYKVLSIFDKKKSFINKRDSILLKHEQLHFDITELISRKLRKKIKESKRLYLLNNYLFLRDKYIDTLKNYQNRYDRETLHSYDSIQQKKWRNKVTKELLELSNYTNDKKY